MDYAYSDLYIKDIENLQGDAFLYIRDILPGVDEKWFIATYMKSHIRSMLDIANPKYAAMPPGELIRRFIEDECNNEYKRGEKWGGFLPEWVGRIYALYQWKYNVPSKDLVDILTLEDMERIFPALHQMGWDAAIDKVHEVVLGNHQ